MAWISSDSTYHRYHMPGFGQFGDSEYRIHHRWEDAASVARFFVILASGAGEEYDEIHIIRIEATDAEDYRTKTMGSANSSVLDVSDYEEVVEYFSLNR